MIPKEFIAWDRKNKRWAVTKNSFDALCVGKDHTLVLVQYRPCNGGYEPQGVELLNNSISGNLDIYQYIGRKDKNGNKVYNGSKIAILRENKIIVQRTIDVDGKYIEDNIPANLGCAGTPWTVIGHIAEDSV